MEFDLIFEWLGLGLGDCGIAGFGLCTCRILYHSDGVGEKICLLREVGALGEEKPLIFGFGLLFEGIKDRVLHGQRDF